MSILCCVGNSSLHVQYCDSNTTIVLELTDAIVWSIISNSICSQKKYNSEKRDWFVFGKPSRLLRTLFHVKSDSTQKLFTIFHLHKQNFPTLHHNFSTIISARPQLTTLHNIGKSIPKHFHKHLSKRFPKCQACERQNPHLTPYQRAKSENKKHTHTELQTLSHTREAFNLRPAAIRSAALQLGEVFGLFPISIELLWGRGFLLSIDVRRARKARYVVLSIFKIGRGSEKAGPLVPVTEKSTPERFRSFESWVL